MAGSIRVAKIAEVYSRNSYYNSSNSYKSNASIQDMVEISNEALEKSREFSSRQKGEQATSNEQNNVDSTLQESLNILNLGKSATKEEIRKAYLYAIKKYHPDKYSGFPPEFVKLAEEKTKEISQSYKNLMSIVV
jgi:DnaJ-domain-containing protein 1